MAKYYKMLTLVSKQTKLLFKLCIHEMYRYKRYVIPNERVQTAMMFIKKEGN